jgi:hypothetical protein
VYLVGASFGSDVAQCFVCEYPQRVRNPPFTTYDSIAGMPVISFVPLIGIAFLAVFFMIY